MTNYKLQVRKYEYSYVTPNVDKDNAVGAEDEWGLGFWSREYRCERAISIDQRIETTPRKVKWEFGE